MAIDIEALFLATLLLVAGNNHTSRRALQNGPKPHALVYLG